MKPLGYKIQSKRGISNYTKASFYDIWQTKTCFSRGKMDLKNRRNRGVEKSDWKIKILFQVQTFTYKNNLY